jgi:protein tyrosine phosphatase (PTP) superfamily phosphohydrolase (DUF442 family)
MRGRILSGLILGFFLFSYNTFVLGEEADQLRQRAKAMMYKASVQLQQGDMKSAEGLKMEAAELMEAAERTEQKAKQLDREPHAWKDREVHELKKHLVDLNEKKQRMKDANAPEPDVAEINEQIARTERELLQRHRPEGREHNQELRAKAEAIEAATKRIEHVRVAAKNLKAAEMHDMAAQLMERVEVMEREVQEAKQRLAAEMRGPQHEPGDRGFARVERELREEIEKLRDELHELREHLKRR